MHMYVARKTALENRAITPILKDEMCFATETSLERTTYFRLVIAVRSAENFTMPAAPHQLEP